MYYVWVAICRSFNLFLTHTPTIQRSFNTSDQNALPQEGVGDIIKLVYIPGLHLNGMISCVGKEGEEIRET